MVLNTCACQAEKVVGHSCLGGVSQIDREALCPPARYNKKLGKRARHLIGVLVVSLLSRPFCGSRGVSRVPKYPDEHWSELIKEGLEIEDNA